MEEEEGMFPKGRKGGTRGRGIWREKKKGKMGEFFKVVRHLIETKCVGTKLALARRALSPVAHTAPVVTSRAVLFQRI
jgi:hypothetical protein